MLPFSIGLIIECIYDKSLITQKIYFVLFKINMQGSNHFIVIIFLLNKKKNNKIYFGHIYVHVFISSCIMCVYIYILLLINGQCERVKQVISLETWFLKFWYEFLTWFS